MSDRAIDAKIDHYRPHKGEEEDMEAHMARYPLCDYCRPPECPKCHHLEEDCRCP